MNNPVFPVAAGYPSYTGTMIPEIWSPKLLYKFYLATVFGAIANTDYEGEIASQGDTVHIRTTPDIIVQDYSKGQKIDYQTPEPNVVDLLIDKGKYWGFKDDYVDRAQADYDYVDDWTDDASLQLQIAIDKQILESVYADADSNNSGLTAGKKSSSFNLGVTGTPLQLTAASVIEFIQDCGTVLDEQDVPEQDRWLVVPPWVVNLIGKSDLKDASLAGDATSIIRNGRVGMIDRFTIYRSNNIDTTVDGADTVYNLIFGHKCAVTFASQLVENEGPLTHAQYFGRFYRGLQVYGFKTVKGEALGHGYVKK